MIENIEKAVNEFPEKDVKVNIQINEWGVYEIKLEYLDRRRRRGRTK